MTAKTIDSAEGHQCQRGQRYYLWARQNTLKDKVAKNCNFGNYLLTPVQMWSRVKFHSLPEIKTSLNELSKLLQHNHIASCFLGQNLYCSCWAKGVSTHPIWSAFTTPTAYSGYNHTFSYQFLGSFCFWRLGSPQTSYTSHLLLLFFRRIIFVLRQVPVYLSCLWERCSTVLLRGCRNVLWTSPDFPSAWGRVGNDWIFILGLTLPFKESLISEWRLSWCIFLSHSYWRQLSVLPACISAHWHRAKEVSDLVTEVTVRYWSKRDRLWL